MAGFWPTPAAAEHMPDLAKRMNELPKVVFSRSLEHASWNNTRLIKDGIEEEIRRMKKASADDLVILGSGTLVAQLTQARLVDEYQFVWIPILLGSGRSMFENIDKKQRLKFKSSRIFRNGNVLLCYESGI
jgi:dihydrofolate reductase